MKCVRAWACALLLRKLACSGFVRMFACLPMYTTINMNCWHTVIVCVDTLLIILVEYRTDERTQTQILHSGQATNPRTDPTKGKNSLAPCQQFGPFFSCQSICRVFCFGTSKLIDASGTGMRRNRIFLCWMVSGSGILRFTFRIGPCLQTTKCLHRFSKTKNWNR